jgi:hypothetical protein
MAADFLPRLLKTDRAVRLGNSTGAIGGHQDVLVNFRHYVREGRLPKTPRSTLPALVLTGSSVAAPAAAKASAAAAIFLRPRFIDGQVASIELLSVQRIDGALGFRVAGHLDEPESLGPACIPIRDNADTVDGSILFKQRTDRIFGGPEAEVSYKYIFQVNFLLDCER